MIKATSEVVWHDIRMDPDDIPGTEEPLIVTLEMFDGSRRVWMDISMEYNDYGNPVFYTMSQNEYGQVERTMVWYPVVAWAYPPDPYSYF